MSNQDVQNSIDEGKHLWLLVQKYAKLELVDKLTSVFTIFILGGVLFAICSIAIYCFCMYLVYLLEAQTGNLSLSFAIVGIGLLLVGFLIYWFRKPLIVRPIIKSLMKDYFEEESNTEPSPDNISEQDSTNRSLSHVVEEQTPNP